MRHWVQSVGCGVEGAAPLACCPPGMLPPWHAALLPCCPSALLPLCPAAPLPEGNLSLLLPSFDLVCERPQRGILHGHHQGLQGASMASSVTTNRSCATTAACRTAQQPGLPPWSTPLGTAPHLVSRVTLWLGIPIHIILCLPLTTTLPICCAPHMLCCAPRPAQICAPCPCLGAGVQPCIAALHQVRVGQGSQKSHLHVPCVIQTTLMPRPCAHEPLALP